MRILSFYALALTVFVNFSGAYARDCDRPNTHLLAAPFNQGEDPDCLKQLEQNGCADLAKKVSPETRMKIKSCDPTLRGLQEDMEGIGAYCYINGLKVLGTAAWDIVTSPLRFEIAVSTAFNDSETCFYDVERKKQMVETFNLSISDPAYRISNEYFKGDYFKNISCEDLRRFIAQKQQKYNGSPTAVAAMRAGYNSPDDSLPGVVSKILKHTHINSACYTSKAKAELACTVAAIAASALLTRHAKKEHLKLLGTYVGREVTTNEILGVVPAATARTTYSKP